MTHGAPAAENRSARSGCPGECPFAPGEGGEAAAPRRGIAVRILPPRILPVRIASGASRGDVVPASRAR